MLIRALMTSSNVQPAIDSVEFSQNCSHFGAFSGSYRPMFFTKSAIFYPLFKDFASSCRFLQKKLNLHVNSPLWYRHSCWPKRQKGDCSD